MLMTYFCQIHIIYFIQFRSNIIPCECILKLTQWNFRYDWKKQPYNLLFVHSRMQRINNIVSCAPIRKKSNTKIERRLPIKTTILIHVRTNKYPRKKFISIKSFKLNSTTKTIKREASQVLRILWKMSSIPFIDVKDKQILFILNWNSNLTQTKKRNTTSTALKVMFTGGGSRILGCNPAVVNSI